MSEPEVLRELGADGVLKLTLNRPEALNAITGSMNSTLLEAARESKRNDAIKVLVITGNGRGFCSGADVSSGGPSRAEFQGEVSNARGRSFAVNKLGPGELIAAFADSDVPIVAAVNGAAAGAGFGLALSCDIRIAAESARMGAVFIKRGVGPDYGTSFWLPRLVGLSRAFEILYSGDLLSASNAFEIGLVHRVVPPETLMEEVMSYARMIAKGPSIAYTYTRRALVRSLTNDLKQQLEYEWENQGELLSTTDAREGFSAFMERREARFGGA